MHNKRIWFEDGIHIKSKNKITVLYINAMFNSWHLVAPFFLVVAYDYSKYSFIQPCKFFSVSWWWMLQSSDLTFSSECCMVQSYDWNYKVIKNYYICKIYLILFFGFFVVFFPVLGGPLINKNSSISDIWSLCELLLSVRGT